MYLSSLFPFLQSPFPDEEKKVIFNIYLNQYIVVDLLECNRSSCTANRPTDQTKLLTNVDSAFKSSGPILNPLLTVKQVVTTLNTIPQQTQMTRVNC